jgi:hypothetical protein
VESYGGGEERACRRVQARGQGGDRQVAKRERVLVSGNGGVLDYHSTLILGDGETIPYFTVIEETNDERR